MRKKVLDKGQCFKEKESIIRADIIMRLKKALKVQHMEQLNYSNN